MRRLIALSLTCLLLLSHAALAWEEASTPLTVTLSYESQRELVDSTVRLVSTQHYYGDNIYEENVGDTIVQYESPCTFKLDLPEGWAICHGTTEGAFAAWQSPDGYVHAELCRLSIPFNSQWYSLFYMSDKVSYSSSCATATPTAMWTSCPA